MSTTIDELKKEARALRVQIEAEGKKLTHGQALELVAKKHGYDNWRACYAAHSGRPHLVLPPKKLEVSPDNKDSDTTITESLERYSLRRTGDIPLRFSGRITGTAKVENAERNNSYQRTTIYMTRAGKYVAEVVFDADHLDVAERKAAVFDDAGSVVNWLRHDDHSLGATANTALRRTAAADPGMAAAYGEDVQ